MEIKLKKPIKIEGKTVKKLKFDISKFTLELENRAFTLLFAETNGQFGIIETSFPYHRIVGMLIAAESNDCEYENLKELSYADRKALSEEARNFLLSGDLSDTETNTEEETDNPAELNEAENVKTTDTSTDTD